MMTVFVALSVVMMMGATSVAAVLHVLAAPLEILCQWNTIEIQVFPFQR